MRIYLAWQRIADGRAQIRRWSPDRVTNTAQNRFVFLGFEGQNTQALAWLTANGEPTWPECLAVTLPAESYCITADDSEFKAWKPKAVSYDALQDCRAINEMAKGSITTASEVIEHSRRAYEYAGYVLNESAQIPQEQWDGILRTINKAKGE